MFFWSSVILLCSGCAEEKELRHLAMIFTTDRSLVLRVKAGMPLRKTMRRGKHKTNNNRRRGEADGQSQSEGHNKVDANRTMGPHGHDMNRHKRLEWAL